MELSSRALVTIAIPTYDTKPEYLAAAVNSALAQTVPVDVLIVDDGSSVPVPRPVAQDMATVRVITHGTNRGIAAALNTSIEATITQWWCWLSADDMITPDKVELQLSATLAARSRCSFHPYRVVTPAGAFLGMSVVPNPWPTIKEQMTRLANNCWVNGSTCMIHHTVFEDVGVFDSEYVRSQDWEMWCRIGEKYLWHLVPQTLGTRREGENHTARIAADPVLQAEQRAEDARIRARYRPA